MGWPESQESAERIRIDPISPVRAPALSSTFAGVENPTDVSFKFTAFARLNVINFSSPYLVFIGSLSYI